MKPGIGIAALAALLLSGPVQAAKTPRLVQPRTSDQGLLLFPSPKLTCNNSRARMHYVTCVPQQAILDKAIEQAAIDSKTVLVEFGADWCVWCKYIDAYFNGWGDDEVERNGKARGKAFGTFMAKNFVVVNLNVDSVSIHPVFKSLGIDKNKIEGYPAFYVLIDGKARVVPIADAQQERKGEFNGYDRGALMVILKEALGKPS